MTDHLQENRLLFTSLASRLIRRHEGVCLYPYRDSMDKWTIGVGRNLSDRGLSVEEVNFLYKTDFTIACDILDIFVPDWKDWPMGPRLGLLSMAYNMGGPRLNSFKKMRTCLMARNFDAAAKEAKDSLWARQVGSRADDVAALITGDMSLFLNDSPDRQEDSP